jgi:hypothetical protein
MTEICLYQGVDFQLIANEITFGTSDHCVFVVIKLCVSTGITTMSSKTFSNRRECEDYVASKVNEITF